MPRPRSAGLAACRAHLAVGAGLVCQPMAAARPALCRSWHLRLRRYGRRSRRRAEGLAAAPGQRLCAACLLDPGLRDHAIQVQSLIEAIVVIITAILCSRLMTVARAGSCWRLRAVRCRSGKARWWRQCISMVLVGLLWRRGLYGHALLLQLLLPRL